MSEEKLRIYFNKQDAEELRDYFQNVLDSCLISDEAASELEHFKQLLNDKIRGRTK